MILALVTQLVRSRVIGADEVDAIATELERDDESDGARMIRAAFAEALAEPEADWRANQARSRFRVVPSDGGNGE